MSRRTDAELLDALAGLAQEQEPERLARYLEDAPMGRCMAYPQEWHEQLLREYEAGSTSTAIAAALGKPASTVRSALSLSQRLGVLSGSQRTASGPVVDWDEFRTLEAQLAAGPLQRAQARTAPPVSRATPLATAPGGLTPPELAALRLVAARELAHARLPQDVGETEVVRMRLSKALTAALRARAKQARVPLADCLAAAVVLFLEGPG